MSDELIIFGTPFPNIENDNKNYVPVWKQKAVSTKGTKRFHGAFEGGFSAGYFNSVGSKEGWKPAEFVSSRDKRYEKNESMNSIDKIENYMDEDDMTEFNSKELIFIDHKKSNDIINILKLNGISEKSKFGVDDDPLQLISKFIKSNATANLKNSHTRENSEAFSGGGAWDEDDEKLEFYEKESSLRHVAKLIESSDKNLDEMLTLAFGNTSLIATENKNNFHSFDIPSDYNPRKVIGNSNVEIFKSKTDKYKTPTDKLIIDIDEKTASSALKGFMPFDEDPEKQTRYIKYLRFCNGKSDKTDVSKSTLYLDEKEREEFIMSAQIFKPSSSLISSRFESSSISLPPQVQLKAGLSRPDFQKKYTDAEKIEPLAIYQPKTKNVESFPQRITYVWTPSSLLCKRFNVNPPETESGLASIIQPKKVKPALADESMENMVNTLLKDSKHKIQFESSTNNQDKTEESLPVFPANDIFEEIFGLSAAETQPRGNRPKATDYFE